MHTHARTHTRTHTHTRTRTHTHTHTHARTHARPHAPTHTHTGVPTRPRTGARAWDIVCLFGTVTFNIGSDQEANRRMMRELLMSAVSLGPKHIVFTAIRRDCLDGINAIQLVGYEKEEIAELISMLSPDSWRIHEEPDPSEWIVMCSFGTR